MSVFFACANANQALILETFGLPTLACKEKAYMPMPCCQEAKVFKVGRSDFTFKTKDFLTADDKKIFIVAVATYSIDATSRGAIMKAYKSFHHSNERVLPRIQSSLKSPFRSYEALETDAEVGIEDIISKLIVDKMQGMSINDITSIDLVFIDTLFEEAKSELEDKNVQLKSIKITEVVQYNGNADCEGMENNETEKVDNSDKYDDANDADTEDNHEDEICEEKIHFEESNLAFSANEIGFDAVDHNVILVNTADGDVEARTYIITVIPEEGRVCPRKKVMTTEVVIDQTSILQLDSYNHVHKTIRTHLDNEEEIAVPEISEDLYAESYDPNKFADTEVHVGKDGDLSAPEVQIDFDPSMFICTHVPTTESCVKEDIALPGTLVDIEIPDVHNLVESDTSIECQTNTTEVVVDDDSEVLSTDAVRDAHFDANVDIIPDITTKYQTIIPEEVVNVYGEEAPTDVVGDVHFDATVHIMPETSIEFQTITTEVVVNVDGEVVSTNVVADAHFDADVDIIPGTSIEHQRITSGVLVNVDGGC